MGRNQSFLCQTYRQGQECFLYSEKAENRHLGTESAMSWATKSHLAPRWGRGCVESLGILRSWNGFDGWRLKSTLVISCPRLWKMGLSALLSSASNFRTSRPRQSLLARLQAHAGGQGRYPERRYLGTFRNLGFQRSFRSARTHVRTISCGTLKLDARVTWLPIWPVCCLAYPWRWWSKKNKKNYWPVEELLRNQEPSCSLRDMWSWMQIHGAGSIKQVTQKLAVGIKQVPIQRVRASFLSFWIFRWTASRCPFLRITVYHRYQTSWQSASRRPWRREKRVEKVTHSVALAPRRCTMFWLIHDKATYISISRHVHVCLDIRDRYNTI